MKNNTTIEEKIEKSFAFIRLFFRLLRIMILHNKNKISFNKILLLTNKEYLTSSNARRTLNSFRKVSKNDLHTMISQEYLLFKNSRNFSTQIKHFKSLSYWIKKLDDTKIIRNYDTFNNNLHNDLISIIQSRHNKIKDKRGQIEADIRFLEDTPEIHSMYLAEFQIYKEKNSGQG
ncbi:hypothetical protein SJPD1_0667 [Sulfurospirillum diekertiae]|uniref:Uncharacterized protein n=1 Tax=Sulfurospirillum diekertiae TaxID=1854492 RepID=A0A290HB48_9BACT|nr:hypothetical protein [Sulfurospirillum diekertiae]ATB68782.1 hypothetical protein SJPD1_0667 [Sulfurospirillum diekertiae]